MHNFPTACVVGSLVVARGGRLVRVGGVECSVSASRLVGVGWDGVVRGGGGGGSLTFLSYGMCLPFNRLLRWLARTSVTASRVLVRGCRPCGVSHLFIYLFTGYLITLDTFTHFMDATTSISYFN